MSSNFDMDVSSSSTSLGVGGLLVGALFLGTGASAVQPNFSKERSAYFQPAITQQIDLEALNNSSLKSGDGKSLEFQKLSLEIMNAYRFSVKLYSEIMGVTRATVYSWHNLNSPIKKVQSKNLDRLNKLNKALLGIKDSRKNLFAEWVSNPLDQESLLIKEMLLSKKIDVDSFFELLPRINEGLYSIDVANELDGVLGLT